MADKGSVIYLKSQIMQILNQQHSHGTRITLSERVNLPQGSNKMRQMLHRLRYGHRALVKFCLLSILAELAPHVYTLFYHDLLPQASPFSVLLYGKKTV